MQRKRLKNADWPAEVPPLAIAAESAEGRALGFQMIYETPDRRPVPVLRAAARRSG